MMSGTDTTRMLFDHYGLFLKGLERFMRIAALSAEASSERAKAAAVLLNGLFKYTSEFMTPFWVSLNAFVATERDKVVRHPLDETVRDYLDLFLFNLQVAAKGFSSSVRAANDHCIEEIRGSYAAFLDTLLDRGGEDIRAFAKRRARLLEKVVYEYPKAIEDIKDEFGFHFDRPGYTLEAETDRFLLYRVHPLPGVNAPERHKPVLIVPPYVLGVNILGFLPGERKSYAHAFANQGIPTYVRVLKDIDTTPAVQTMTGEDDALDTRRFCELIASRHRRPVTLNGFCQGGFIALLDILTGELDGLVDALVTCVAPIDGTRSKALVEYLEHLPQRFRDLGYAVKQLENGNAVVNGKVMSWVYKLKSMEKEAPVYTFFRDLALFDNPSGGETAITKTAAALNHWLVYDRKDIPVAITALSFDSYTVPIAPDGTMPVKLFGKKLNIKDLGEKGITYLICYASADDLVDRESALAPLDFVQAEVTVFPKGHGAIATTWSAPDSEYAVHKRFPQGMRGPVRFQLDLDEELSGGEDRG